MSDTFAIEAWLVGGVIVIALIALRYLLIAGGALLLIQVFRNRLAPRCIQPNPVTRTQMIRETLYSCSTVCVFAIVFISAVAFDRFVGGLQIYYDMDSHGWLWFAFSIPIALIIHDFYFYWAHRFMHLPGVFERIHRVHHLSTNPSPLAAFAFHPIEAVIEATAILMIAAIMPVHPVALFIIALLAMLSSVTGHLGYELLPQNWAAHTVLGFFNTATSHNQHHARFRCNYGLYSLVWDRAFGTLHPDYVDLYRKVTDPARALSLSPPKA